MKKLIFTLLICISANTLVFSQILPQKMSEQESFTLTKKQLKIRHKKAVNIIYTGAAITGVGVIASVVGVAKYLEHSENVIEEVDSGLLPAIISNQAQMNKSIPAALLATSGFVLASIGATIIVKGVMKKNDIEFAFDTYGASSVELGVKINF